MFKGAIVFFVVSQKGRRAGLELREIPAAARVIPAAVGELFLCRHKGINEGGSFGHTVDHWGFWEARAK